MRDDAISQISADLETLLLGMLKGQTRYALLDFPSHTNIGDSAIYVGELTLLDRIFGRPADCVTTLHTPMSAIGQSLPEGVLLLHGGGNFGDLWSRYQDYRLAVLEAYPERMIVQLPQSIHFSSEANRDATARAIAKHGNFTMLVRDRKSLAIAQESFECETFLTPDMAYGMAPPQPEVAEADDVLCLMRLDHERQKGRIERKDFAQIGRVDDWPIRSDPPSLPRRMAIRATESIGPAGLMRIRERLFRAHATSMTTRGFDLLASARYVVTDRLHGHIMSSLLGRPHVVLDNSYGKLSNFIQAWPRDIYTRQASDLEEARARLSELRDAFP